MKTNITPFLDIKNKKSTKNSLQKPFLNKEPVSELIDLEKIVGGAYYSIGCTNTCNNNTAGTLCIHCN